MSRILKNSFFIVASLCCSWISFAQAPAASEVVKPDQVRPAEVPYGTLEKDLRLCAFPMCGGYWIRPLNGTLRSIYVSRLDLSVYDANSQKIIERGLGGSAIVKGRIKPTLAPHLGNTLEVTEAYAAQKGSLVSPAKATFIKAHKRLPPINCVVAPCPNLIANVLNTPKTVSFDRLDASSLTIPMHEKLLLSPHVILAGSFVDGTEEFPGGYELIFSVEALYRQLPARPDTPVILSEDEI